MIAIVDNKKLRQEFAQRLHIAADEAGLPPQGIGRATAIRDEISKRVKPITLTGVAKWLDGESLPGNANMEALADWLGVRREWLQYNQLPKYGSVQLPSKAGPLTARLAAKIANLESTGKLNRKLCRAIESLLDDA